MGARWAGGRAGGQVSGRVAWRAAVSAAARGAAATVAGKEEAVKGAARAAAMAVVVRAAAREEVRAVAARVVAPVEVREEVTGEGAREEPVAGQAARDVRAARELMVVAMERPAPPRVPCDAQMLTRDLRRLGCGCGRCLVTGSRVICETTQIGCPWSRPRVSIHPIFLFLL